MKPWTPELEVTLQHAQDLIIEQFPELKPIEIEYLDSGWDNVVYRVNGRWYFRFPQRKIAVDGVIREMECLPVLEKSIGLTPKVLFRGQPTATYPYPFFGYEPLQGVEACQVSLSNANRLEIAKDLGLLLKKLHSKDIDSKLSGQLPFDPLDRLNFPKKIAQTEARLAELQKHNVDLQYDDLIIILRAALQTPRRGPTAVVHGDLHFRHLIITSDLRLGGLIDWGDMHRNSPAVDLQLYWSFFSTAEARLAFKANYGVIDDVEFVQARSFGVFVNIALLQYSLDIKNTAMQREALLALQNLLVETD